MRFQLLVLRLLAALHVSCCHDVVVVVAHQHEHQHEISGSLSIGKAFVSLHRRGHAITAKSSVPSLFVPSSNTRARSSPRSFQCIRSSLFLASANSNDDADNSDESSFNSNFDSTTNCNSNSRQKKRFITPQIVDAFAQRQISNIFGSVSAGSVSGNAFQFVPLSMAGRCWSSSQNKSEDLIETVVLLSSPEQCQTIADAYEQYLLHKPEQDISNNDNDQTSIMPNNNNNNEPSIAMITALPIPIPPSMSINAIKLLSQTYSSKPLSKSVLLSLNSLFINRDGGLFDNLPWSTWSIDPTLQERDAANNVVESKYTMGKRVAYQRFMGKDWQGRSLSLGNLAKRVRYLLEGSLDRDGEEYYDENDGGSDGMESLNDADVMISLSQRLLQLEMKEARMEIAESEQRLAISRTQSKDDVDNVDEKEEAEKLLKKACERLQVADNSLQELMTAMQSVSEEGTSSFFSFALPWDKDTTNGSSKQSKTQSLLTSILDKLSEQENPPPYRGAIGYPAKLDSKREVFEESILPYSSPYELLLEIIEEQLNSEVVGCVLEPTSLLDGNLVLGGALLLKRKGVQKYTTLSGERVSYTDDDNDLGNEGVLPRSMYVVECFSDEAVGMAMASGMPLFVEEEICNRAGNVPVELSIFEAAMIKVENGGQDCCVKDMESLSFVNRVPPICPSDESKFGFQMEGEGISSERELNSVRIPLSTNPQLFGGPNQVPQSAASSSGKSVFSTFNPVKTLDEYDSLNDDAKARLLLKVESFTDVLPRPRAVRTSTIINSGDYEEGSPPSILDDILMPLVDESVRRQYRIRDAERRKDFKEADALRNEVSPRQNALEKAQQAREEGLDDEAIRLEEEARLYKALRADATQDEGAYSRYLDRDEWYERETRARIKRLDKSKFGTLLDGVDLP